ncbi:right-handed parallel beta-helix repeat-containing protein [Pontiellaceae bacterium B12219]|nr:right-handed parallel beta-helix repeat-containing protein [Pontiellaceae bacterium B12219]
MTKNKVHLFIHALFLLAGSCLATEYFVSTQAEFNAVTNAVLQSGDAILLERGQQFIGMLAPTGTGTEAAPIRIGAYGSGERPQIHAMGVNEAAVRLLNPSYWEIQGLEVTNTDGTDDDQGDLFGIFVFADVNDTYTHVYIDDNYIHDVNGKVGGKGRGGIHVRVHDSRQNTKFDDLRITNNRIEDVGGVGIGNYAKHSNVDLLPDGELFTENLWTRVYVAGNYLNRTGRNAIIARASIDAIYEFNTLANSSRYSSGHSIFCFDTAGMKIQYNEAYGNVGNDTHDRGGFDADYNCVDTIIQYNYSHDNEWFCGIMKKKNRNVIIRYNVSRNEKQGIYWYGFETDTDLESCHIYNNTHFTRSGLNAAIFARERTPLNTIFENNIFYYENPADSSLGVNAAGTNCSFNNNLYFNVTPHPADANPLTADPLFVQPGAVEYEIDLTTMEALNGYQVRSSSPCIDAAIPIANNGGLDIVKAVVGIAGADIGALEYQGPVTGLTSGVTFDFLAESVWDGGSGGGQIGSNATRKDEATGIDVTLTTLDVIGQDGTLASDGIDHRLNITGAAGNFLGVNHDGANLSNSSAEWKYFNPNEGWVFSFNEDVYLKEIQLTEQDDDAEMTLLSAAFPDIVMPAGQPGDIHDLGDTLVPAGTAVTLLMTSAANGIDVDVGLKTFTVVPVNAQQAYESWADLQGLTEGQNAAYDDDPDEDGMDNLVEYALGSQALINDAASYLPSIRMAPDRGTNFMNLVYRRRIDAAERGLDYQVGATTNLLAGPITNATEEAGSVVLDVDFQQVTNRVPIDAKEQQFMQLRIITNLTE